MVKKTFLLACLFSLSFTVPALAASAMNQGSDATVPYIDATQGVGDAAATSMAFKLNGTEMMRVTATGSVGIGTAAPSERLDLGGGNIKMGYEIIYNSCGALANGTTECRATCSSGKSVLSGGCNINGAAVRISQPYGSSGWSCYSTAASVESVASAICANIK